MLANLTAAGVALMAGWAAWGQTAAPLSFEVASVKPAVPCCAPGQWREGKAGVDRIDFPNVTLRYCLAFAYGVKEYQISGPAWLGSSRFDILAKGSEGTRHEQLPDMMQALLAERFKLQVHHETKEFGVIALIVGKNGPKLKESPPPPGGGGDGAMIGMSMSGTGVGRMEVKQGNMTALANTLSRMLGSPVVDTTGLAGRYDFDLEFSPDDSRGMMTMPATTGGALPSVSEPVASIYSSIQQLGLKLEARKVPMDAIVVDAAEKTPTGN
jgi:uncharacterized protein (TIGR03435 family)